MITVYPIKYANDYRISHYIQKWLQNMPVNLQLITCTIKYAIIITVYPIKYANDSAVYPIEYAND